MSGQRSRGGRQGNVFALRLPPAVRERLEALCSSDAGPRKLGPWLVWRALGSAGPGTVIPELGQYREVKVWGGLPCTEFSLAKNGHERDFVAGLETVNACLRLVLQTKPRWWALENPVGLLGRWLGRPTLVFEPHHYGDPWSKRTALWGEFNAELKQGPFVQAIDGGGPLCSVCFPDDPRVCSISDHRAVTPAGFARAFFEANP